MNSAKKPEVLAREIDAVPAMGSGNVDMQIATAKRYPRSIVDFTRRATEMATLTADIAATCIYAVPRDGETIEGPSARLAEIIANAWTNMRIQAGVTDEDDRFVTARGEAWDLETNVAIGFEVKRRITKRGGQKYSDDMVMTTGNAAASIALRNAVLKAVPTPVWRPIYLKVRQVIAGDQQTFAARRDEMLKKFAVMGVTEQRFCDWLDVKGKGDITLEHMVKITGVYNALKDGEASVDEVFPGIGTGPIKQAERVSQPQTAQPQTTTSPATTAPAETSSVAAPAATDSGTTAAGGSVASGETLPAPTPIGRVVKVWNVTGGVVAFLDTGFQAGTKDPGMTEALKALEGKPTRVELVTRASSNPKAAPTLEEIRPIDREPGEDDR